MIGRLKRIGAPVATTLREVHSTNRHDWAAVLWLEGKEYVMKDGDVVELVNGQTLTSPADIMEVGEKLAKARPGAKVRVNVLRGDDDLAFNYLLVK